MSLARFTTYLVGFFLILAPGQVFSGWEFGGKISVVQVNDGPRLKAVATSEYRIQEALSWRTDLEFLFADPDELDRFTMAVPSNLIYYPLRHRAVMDPYFGPGLVYTHTISGMDWFGGNVLAGISFPLKKGKSIGIEAKYTVSNFFDWTVSDNFEIGLRGNWELGV